MVTVVVIGLQVVAMCTWVAVLYFGYFYIQSTEMEAWRQVLLNGLNSTIWGISLEFLNFIIFYKVNLTLTPSLTLTLNLTLTLTLTLRLSCLASRLTICRWRPERTRSLAFSQPAPLLLSFLLSL